jgi:hypothetical protein
MTVATALRSVRALAYDGSSELFDLLCLIDCLGRAARAGNESVKVTIRQLNDAIHANPAAALRLKQAEAYERANAKVRRLRQRADRLQAAANRLNRTIVGR